MRRMGVQPEPSVLRELVHTLSASGADLELLFALRKRARASPEDLSIPAQQRDAWLRQARADFARVIRLCLRLAEEGWPLLPSTVYLLFRYCDKHDRPYVASSLLSVLHHRKVPLDSRCMGAYFAAGARLTSGKEVNAYARLGLQVMLTQAIPHTTETYEGLLRLYHLSGDAALLEPVMQEMQRNGQLHLLNGRMVRLLIAGLKRAGNWQAADNAMAMLRRLSLLSAHKEVLSDSEKKDLLLTPQQARSLLNQDPDLLMDVASSILVTLQFLSPAPAAYALELAQPLRDALAAASAKGAVLAQRQQQHLAAGYSALLSTLLRALVELESSPMGSAEGSPRQGQGPVSREELEEVIKQAVEDIKAFERTQRQRAAATKEAPHPQPVKQQQQQRETQPLLVVRAPGPGRSPLKRLSLASVRSPLPEGLRDRLAELLGSSPQKEKAPVPESAQARLGEDGTPSTEASLKGQVQPEVVPA